MVSLPGLQDHLVHALRLAGRQLVLEALVGRDSILERLPDIDSPTLVIVGAEDASLPVACSQEIAATIPNSQLVVVPGAGHLSSLENPEAVNRAMIGFLDSFN